MSAAVASPQVIVFEETFSSPVDVTPKVRALQERLANAKCEKDAKDLKEKFDQRMAKSAALVEKANAAKSPKKNPTEEHHLNVVAQQMENASAKAAIAEKDRLRLEKAEQLKAEQKAERAAKLMAEQSKSNEAHMQRVAKEEEFKLKAQDNLMAMDKRLEDFHSKREKEYKAMCDAHVDRVARREALLDRMHDKDVLTTDQMRTFQEQRQSMAEARRLEQIREKEQAVADHSDRVSKVAQQVKATKEEELTKRKMAIDTKQAAAAERRNEQLAMKNSQRSPKGKFSPKKARVVEEAAAPAGWMSVVGSVAVAAFAAAGYMMARR